MPEKEKDDESRIEQKLLKQRIILLFDIVEEVSAADIIQSMIMLDSTNQKPIKLLINSIGGCVSDGLAIIDVMNAIKSPVETFIVGSAMSMAAIISVCGSRRYVTPNGVWMQHSSRVSNDDHIGHVKDRLTWDIRQEAMMNDLIRKRTKLTPHEIERMDRGELWFSAEEMVQKGICDKIVTKFYREK